jgi:hypothetical protein
MWSVLDVILLRFLLPVSVIGSLSADGREF